MPHIVMGEIRRDVFTREGTGSKGPWKMYAVDLSETVKDRDGNKHYANYRATFFATERQRPYYDEWLQKGKIVGVTSEKLKVVPRQGNDGQTYVTLEMDNPQLTFTQRGDVAQQQNMSGASGQQSGQNNGGWGQPQQQQSRQQAQQNEPPMEFDDDIPF